MLRSRVKVISYNSDCDLTADSLDTASESGSSSTGTDTIAPPSSNDERIFDRLQAVEHRIAPSVALQSPSSTAPLDSDSQSEAHRLGDSPMLGDGIKIATVSEDSAPNDLDYELFRLDATAYNGPNRIRICGVQASSLEYVYLRQIAKTVTDSKVVAATGTTGTVRGTITSSAYYIKMECSRSYQELWAVRLEGETGEFTYGFVLCFPC